MSEQRDKVLEIGSRLSSKRFELRWALADAAAFDGARLRILRVLSGNLIGRADGSWLQYAVFRRPADEGEGGALAYRVGVVVHMEGGYGQRMGERMNLHIGGVAPRLLAFSGRAHEAHLAPYAELGETLLEGGLSPPIPPPHTPAGLRPEGAAACSEAPAAAAPAAAEAEAEAASAAEGSPAAAPAAAPEASAVWSDDLSWRELLAAFSISTLGPPAEAPPSAAPQRGALEASPAAAPGGESDGAESTGSAQSRPPSAASREGGAHARSRGDSAAGAAAGPSGHGPAALPGSARRAQERAGGAKPAGASADAPASSAPSPQGTRRSERRRGTSGAPAASVRGSAQASPSGASCASEGAATAPDASEGSGRCDASSWRSKS